VTDGVEYAILLSEGEERKAAASHANCCPISAIAGSVAITNAMVTESRTSMASFVLSVIIAAQE
jgi:hypothetical protein